jgi:hypothetical protein
MLTSSIDPYKNTARNPSRDAHNATNLAMPHMHRKTQSEDLHILAHAQGQLREHLEPPESQTYQHQQQQSPYQDPFAQRPHSALQMPFPHQPQPQSTARPRSSHQFATHSDYLRSMPNKSSQILHAPVTHPTFQWWEHGGVFDDDTEGQVGEDSVIESIEVDDISPGSLHDSISPGSLIQPEMKLEDEGEDEQARPWDETQWNWNGYVKHEESWVRRAGLKRKGEGKDGRQDPFKRERLGE